MPEIDRRKFLGGLAALTGASLVGCRSGSKPAETTVALPPTTQDLAGLGMEEADAPVMSDGRPAVRMILTEADGSAIETEKMRTLHARDLANDPLPQAIATAEGRARLELANEPMQIVMRLKVPGFGEVYCFADNDSRGYTKAETRNFVLDAAITRLRRVMVAWEKLKPSGLKMSSRFHDRLEAAVHIFRRPEVRVAAAYEALAYGLHAGEELALANAKHRIARLAKPREDFKFGVMVSGFDSLGPEYDKRVRELFDFATVGWYWWNDEAKADKGDFINYQRMDASVQWCLDRKITPKNFGYLYMARGATPEWIRPNELPATRQAATSAIAASTDNLPRGPINTLPNSEPSNAKREFNSKWPYDRVKKTYEQVIRQTMQRFHGRCPVAEIMNEAHDKANLWGLNHEQILDFAKMAFRAAREGSPTVQRMMNHCCMWGEYAKNRNGDGSRRWSPHQFIKTCFDNGIDYEVIGLQLYYPQHDVFEIDRMLDRFNEFNKPIHITEIATASQDGLDPESMRPKTYAPGWHGPWNPTLQADWSEAMWTLLYSKPNYKVVGWWDFVDVKGHFWPFGGLLTKELQPKEAYHRLLKLKQDWGLTSAAARPPSS